MRMFPPRPSSAHIIAFKYKQNTFSSDPISTHAIARSLPAKDDLQQVCCPAVPAQRLETGRHGSHSAIDSISDL